MAKFDEEALDAMIVGRLRPPDAARQSKTALLKRIRDKLEKGGKITPSQGKF